MKTKNARDVAISAITAFRKRNAWSDGFLRNEIRANNLPPRDAALATAIANGVLQNSLLLNYYISKYSSLKFNKIAPGIVDIIQMAAYQILFLDRVPDSAAVNDAVDRAKRNNPRAAGFVNAITRKLSAEKDSLPKITGTPEEILSVKYSHPLDLVKTLLSEYGLDMTEKILVANNAGAKATARVNTLKTTAFELVSSYKEVFSLENNLISDAVSVNFSGNIENNQAYKNGLFHIQDISSQIAALTLSPQKGMKVLDACAAPGGKSFLLAELMENEGELISCDIHEHKLSLIGDGAKRLGINVIKPILSDATQYKSEYEAYFDCVLADVPCSGLGIIRKKPDIRYKDVSEISDLPEIQLKIIKNVSRYVKPGGALLYSTCTILSRENSDIVAKFLAENTEFTEECATFDIPHIKNEHGVTFLPSLGETDGFYICKLRRNK